MSVGEIVRLRSWKSFAFFKALALVYAGFFPWVSWAIPQLSAPDSAISPQILESAPIQVRVRLLNNPHAINIRGMDLQIAEIQNRRRISPQKIRGQNLSEWNFRCRGGLVSVAEIAGKGRKQLRAPLRISSPSGYLQLNGRSYREEIQIVSNGGDCWVLNVIDIEKYLDGLINAEFSSRWNPEAVKAQAIAARSYALHQHLAAAKSGRLYDLAATIEDQVFEGPLKEDVKASRFVADTRGMVLFPSQKVFRGGDAGMPLKAFYHAICGGSTQLPESVWKISVPGFRRKVRCMYCKDSPHFNWAYDLRESELNTFLLARNFSPFPNFKNTRIYKVDLDYDDTGRVKNLLVRWMGLGPLGVKTETVRVAAQQLRGMLDPIRFRSTTFKVDLHQQMNDRVFRFEGRGFGHGVGMCQWGAKVMGDRGFRVGEILSNYYPDAELRKLW